MDNKGNTVIYEARPVMIHYISRASVKVNDNFYTVEYGEDRQVPENCQDLDFEREALIERCNLVVDNQVEEIVKTFLKK